MVVEVQWRGAEGAEHSPESGDDEEAINRMFSPEFRNRLDAVVGFKNLTRRLIEVAEDKKVTGSLAVQYFKNAKVDRRLCTGIVVRRRERS